jgi:hypothetical protein
LKELVFTIIAIFSLFASGDLFYPSYAQICPDTSENDRDGDSIPNDWEINGIDINKDGQIDLDIGRLGADPLHKDIFVEVDYMQDRKPIQKAFNNVISQFDHAPLCNPDGISGITLHIEVDEEVPHNQYIDMDQLRQIKSLKQGTLENRNDTNCDNIIKAKELLYYYSLFADRQPEEYSGQADGIPKFIEPSTKTFMVTLGSEGWAVDPTTGQRVGNIDQQSGTFMHELGHSLGLPHGGRDHGQFKPNYLSVMNYAFQASSILGTRNLDYSRCEINELDEMKLDEDKGISKTCPPGMLTIIYGHNLYDSDRCKDKAEVIPTGIPVDWDKNNLTNGTAIPADLNCDGEYSSLGSIDDWNNLVFPLENMKNSNVIVSTIKIPELRGIDIIYHGTLLANDAQESIENIETFQSATAGLGLPQINSTELEEVKDNATKTIGSLNTTNDVIVSNETHGIVAPSPKISSVDNSTVTELIVSQDVDLAVEKLEQIQSNLNSTLTGVPNATRTLIGETEAQQKINNLKQVLEKQQWGE